MAIAKIAVDVVQKLRGLDVLQFATTAAETAGSVALAGGAVAGVAVPAAGPVGVAPAVIPWSAGVR